ncbi:hypothetical protein [Isoptericola sp. QY 916]|uniref:hypothetical protein n=1 Tax=Isoptericola sp. QY 916 TaxID=2782570 RepID=UPI003D2FDFF5|nr:hypothetical protein [Isoptericola sp. QY 916]
MTLTAHAPTRDILTSLARGGWGELSGSEHKGTRAMLRALVDLLPYGSGEGLVTASQIADVSGYSERWVRSRLTELEARGLILWRRGGVVAGKCVPSHVRIVKGSVLALLRLARSAKDAAIEARRAVTRRRVEGLTFVMGKRRHSSIRKSLQASSPSRGSLPTLPRHGLSSVSECGHGEPRGSAYCALCRRGIPA